MEDSIIIKGLKGRDFPINPKDKLVPCPEKTAIDIGNIML